MAKFSEVVIIFNPNSTGSSKSLARKLRDDLKANYSETVVKLVSTKYAGHAEEIAYSHSISSKYPLIISSSGDGGYHEVVNGVMRSKARACAGLIPAGNANDHYNAVHAGDLIRRIKEGDARKIDLLKMDYISNSKSITEYAHSYIGLGLSPKVGRQLNKTNLNQINEKWITLKAVMLLKHSSVIINGQIEKYDSLVFSNIPRMAKVLTPAKESEPDDGLFEISTINHTSKFNLLRSLLIQGTFGSTSDQQVNKFEFTTIKPTLVQLDGEIRTLDSQSKSTVSIVTNGLSCIV